MGKDHPVSIRCVSLEMDMKIIEGIEDDAEDFESERQWEPIFSPKAWADENPDPQLEDYRLDMETLAQYGVAITELRKKVRVAALEAE